jgi:hypothetical protein
VAALCAALLAVSPAAAQLMNGAAGWSYITTVKATSATTLQLTGANWSTNYNTLFINCAGLLVSHAGDAIAAYVGEGSGPTWEVGNGSNAGYTDTDNQVADLAVDIFNGNYSNFNTTTPVSMKFFIYNPGSSTMYKMIYLFEYGEFSAATGEAASGLSWWAEDTNPLTGFELKDSGSGNIKSGQCSLYGMN